MRLGLLVFIFLIKQKGLIELRFPEIPKLEDMFYYKCKQKQNSRKRSQLHFYKVPFEDFGFLTYESTEFRPGWGQPKAKATFFLQSVISFFGG